MLTCLTRIASAQPLSDEAKKYQQQQQNLTQDIRAISESLLTEELKGRKADKDKGDPGTPGEFAKIERTYTSVIRRGTPQNNGPEVDAVRTGLKYRIYSLTDPEIQSNWRDLDVEFGKLVRDIGAASSIQNPQDQQQFRTMVCREALPLLEEVINKGNLDARSLAIAILPELEVLSPGAIQKRREMFDEVDEALIRILKDEKQPDVVKLRAASAAKRYLIKADAVPQVQLALADALLAELQNPLSEWEYQYVLIESLAHTTVPREVVGVKKASITEAMVVVMQDSRRDILVRCAAAGALGRVGFDAQINFEPLAWATVKLAVEAALKIGQQPPSTRRELCGWQLYLAFHHGDKDGRNDPRNPQGMLNRKPGSEFLRAAYNQVLPLARSLMFANGNVPNNEILDADAWVKANQPASLSYDAQSPALTP